MKKISSPNIVAVEYDDWDAADRDDLKELAFPDDLTGEIFLKVHTRWAFEGSGYRLRRAEKAETHPVFFIQLLRTTAQRITDDKALFKHIQQLLSAHRIKLKKPDLSVSRTGDRILVAFLMQAPAGEKC